MSLKKLAIFDFDGTLFDSIEDVLICFNKALEIHNFTTLTREELIPRLGGNIDEIVSLVLAENCTPENFETFKRTYLDLYDNSQKENTIPFAQSKNLLKSLEEKGVVLAVNSNRLTYSLNEFIEKYFEDINFVSIEGNHIDLPSKPNPYGVDNIIKKTGISKDEAIYIGDSTTDILTAKNAGVDCLIVKWGYGLQKDYESEDILAVVESPLEILKYF